jgi:hypothetical protein
MVFEKLAQSRLTDMDELRDEAMRQTRKLQAAINVEREKVDALMQVSNDLWVSTAPRDDNPGDI